MPKISVIICAYNAAEYLKTAARSVLAQSFRDIELIIVNDGSKDATLAVAHDLAMKDDRVRVVNTPNGGVAKARNIGVYHAKGDYITFCDADDYLEDGAFEAMYEAAEANRSDMVISGYFHETVLRGGDRSIVEISSPDAVYGTKRELYRDFIDLKSKYLVDAMCNKLFRRSVIKENGVRFIEGELFEDTAFALEFLEVTQKLTVINKCFYHYIQHTGQGITRRYDPNKLRYLTDRYRLLLEFAADGDEALQKFCHLYQVRNVYSCLSASFGAKDMPKNERKRLIKEAVNDSVFSECAKKADGAGLANRLTLFVAKSKSLFLNRLYCKGIYLAKTKAAVLFTKFKR